MKRERVSGNIWAEPESHGRDDETYVVRNVLGQGWQLPTKDLEPADLRALADRIEERRSRGAA
jgi:hypothetical protein